MVKRLLETGERFLRKSLKAIDGVTVTYLTDGETINCTATIGQIRRDNNSQEDLDLQAEFRDFLIEVADLVDGVGTPIRPEPNHRIQQAIAGNVEEFRVAQPPGMADCYEYSDRNRELYRIHSKFFRNVP